MRDLILVRSRMADSRSSNRCRCDGGSRLRCASAQRHAPLAGGWHVYRNGGGGALDHGGRSGAARRGAHAHAAREALGASIEPRPSLRCCVRSSPTRRWASAVSLGWFCDGDGDDFCFGHQGVDGGFIAEMKVFPARGKRQAVIINAHGWLLPGEIFKAIGREYGWPAASSRAPSIAMPPGIAYAGISQRKRRGGRGDPVGRRALLTSAAAVPISQRGYGVPCHCAGSLRAIRSRERSRHHGHDPHATARRSG